MFSQIKNSHLSSLLLDLHYSLSAAFHDSILSHLDTKLLHTRDLKDLEVFSHTYHFDLYLFMFAPCQAPHTHPGLLN